MDHCSVYLISDESNNCCKIGISKDPNARLKKLQTSNPSKLVLYFSHIFTDTGSARTIERQAHKKLEKYRMQGEWFAISIKHGQKVLEELVFPEHKKLLDEEQKNAKIIELQKQLEQEEKIAKEWSAKLAKAKNELDEASEKWRSHFGRVCDLRDEIKLLEN